MPDTPGGVATTRRRLRTELRRLREAARLHQADVAKELDWSISKLIRIENGSVGISVTDLRALAGVYGADAATVEQLVRLARVTRSRQWWSAYRHLLSPSFREFISYEADAARLIQMHPAIVPGLLQTTDYMRAVIASTALTPLPEEHIEALVTVRLTRQREVLGGPHPPQFIAIVDEAVLRRQVGGPAVLRAQLEHLAQLTDTTVQLAVLPFGVGGHPGMQGAFHIMEFADPQEQSVLFLETALGHPVQRDQQEVDQYRAAFYAMYERSLRDLEAIAFIRKLAEELG